MAESSVACASASRRYTIIPHRGHACRAGQGRITGCQKSSAVRKKHACSTWCQRSDRSATIVQRGRMPCPERDDERHPRDARLREDAGEPPHGPRRQHRGHRVPRAKRQPCKQRRHRRAQPEQRGRHHHQQAGAGPCAPGATGGPARRSASRAPGARRRVPPRTPPRARPRSARACAAGAPPSRAGRARRPRPPARPPSARSSTRARWSPGPGRRARRPDDSCAGAARRAKHTCSRWRRISTQRRPCSMSSFRRQLKETHLRPLRRRAQRRP